MGWAGARPPLPLRHPAVWLATWFGAGLLPKAPGTWGSLAALPFAWLILRQGGAAALFLAAALAFAAGVWASARYAAAAGDADPAPVVIDEVAGQWLTLAIAGPAAPWQLVAGFALFRLFDIAKPWPVRRAERLPGGWGIMADDMAAAAYAGAILYAIVHGIAGMQGLS